MSRLPTLLAGLCAGLFASPWLQDPVKPTPAPTPPASATPQVPDQAPKPDGKGHPAPHPLQGVYTLRARVLDGKTDILPSRGYLAITQRHLFLCLAAPGPEPDAPLVRAGVRSWKPLQDLVDATILMGWYNDKDGGLHIEKPGSDERRRIELMQGGVRVVQDERNWLEFERIE